MKVFSSFGIILMNYHRALRLLWSGGSRTKYTYTYSFIYIHMNVDNELHTHFGDKAQLFEVELITTTSSNTVS